jgi:spore germination protein
VEDRLLCGDLDGCNVVATLAPGSAQSGTANVTAPHRLVSTWIPYWNSDRSLRDVVNHGRLFEYASPFWYSATTARTIVAEPGAGSRAVVAALHRHGIAVVPTVTEAWGPRTAANLLGSESARRVHVSALVALARRFDGIDLDYEQMALTTRPRLADRVSLGFTKLVTSLCTRLKRLNRRCDVTVMARTTDRHVIWRRRLATWEYDYAAIGAVASRLRIMAYAQHGPHETAGPLAPPSWIEAILRYATARVPAAVVELDVPFYGYDWSRGGVVPVSYAQATSIRVAHHRPYAYSSTGGAPHFAYTDSRGVAHTVWYEDRRSLRDELHVATAFHVRHIGAWYMGLEDTGDWLLLRRFAD